MKDIKKILEQKNKSRDYRNSHEFQAYGNRLAEELNDSKHRALYLRLAKNEDRSLLERAREFVISQENVTTKGRLFMWKLSELKKESNQFSPKSKKKSVSQSR